MTFEEFLTKKKIDLAQFRTAEPGLFAEFQSHYSQMGEKSFDHSKKFLFNKLRRSYHLKEEPKPVPAKETIEINEIAAQAEPLISPTLEATVYTPRLKTTGVPASGSAEAPANNSDKPVYKPRFKAPAAGDARPATKPEPSGEPAEQSKPAFKPRFKPGITKTAETGAEEIKTNNIPEEKPKPAYVPRFKPTVTPAEPPAQNDTVVPAEESKPAYKPRFKANITPAPEPAPETEITTPASPPVEEKPVYRPRFKPTMVKPKKEDE